MAHCLIRSFALALVLAPRLCAGAVDFTGTWTATFESVLGREHYTFELSTRDADLSGWIHSWTSQSPVENGLINGDEIYFVEFIELDGQQIRVSYVGRRVTANIIEFSRKLGDLEFESLIATRAPTPTIADARSR